MAMSLKKIGSIAVAGAMVATALASGVSAVQTIGFNSYDELKPILVKDGQPNCYVVVGANAPSTMDVVSAADIAAKIGSLCYKESSANTGCAELTVHVEAAASKVEFDASKDKALLYAVTPDDTDYQVTDVIYGGNTFPHPEYTWVNTTLNGSISVTTTNATDEVSITELNATGTQTYVNDTYVYLPSTVKLTTTPSGNTTSLNLILSVEKINTITKTLSTLMKIDDLNPKDIKTGIYENLTNSKADSIELGFYELVPEGTNIGIDLVGYATTVTKDSELNTSNVYLAPGILIPFLGEQYMFVKADKNNNELIIGKEAYSGILQEGEIYDVGNGYQVKIKAVLEPTTGSSSGAKVDVQILKDGQVVAEKFDYASTDSPLILTYGPIGVIVTDAYKNIAETTGYADCYIVKDLKYLKLGSKYEDSDYKIYAVLSDGTHIDITKNTDIDDDTNGIGVIDGKKICGIALVDDTDPTDSDNQLSSKGDTFSAIDNYFTLKVDKVINASAGDYKIYIYSDVSKDVTLDVGQEVSALNAQLTLDKIEANAIQPTKITAPIAKLDTEVSLDNADKNLVLVGGPVANKLTKELVDMGKINITNDSPATIALIKGVANGHDVIVVAGGNREKTREAALALIENL
ncbi:S-layer protein [Methanocaldococcus indicus]|uniref:S-layer protein n=1 Tax=Methanocaldococcus indicus TaxID=213231 RepID=UPI003C6D36F3